MSAFSHRFLCYSVFAFVLVLFFVLIHFQNEINKLRNDRQKYDLLIERYSQRLNEDELKSESIGDESENGAFAASVRNTGDDDTLIIYNRVPKTGSTSFMGIAYDLCKNNRFNVIHLNVSKNNHVLSLSDQSRFVYNVSNWSERQPSLYHGHIAFIDFSKFGVRKKPIYINIIREPLSRLVSYYYFLRFGDNFRPYVVRKRQGNKVSFDECVERKERDCDPNNMWLQIPFFCGHSANCWIPGNEWALQEAKRNLIQHYLLVGVTEDIHAFIAILESTLPRFFKGATKLYEKGVKSHLRKTYNKLDPLPETVEKVKQSKIWRMEFEFYQFALQQFHFVKQRTLISFDNLFKDKGNQFFYEKIRPR
ncbi:Heparan sulfate 2-O-sulfotransferase 1-like protein [Dinothrombium tinctorium]|uniref:Heparan sulfate 2-O-sulfotransferase 1-like protein n=1 Tax=Dinothrombium tinctorium TaxID=1965070 RepID=A0A443QU45_9ACAR|nr:Heparan sulfate 2-O-sulfotransferase 1-like protein [Dinothrombium tinctorium]